MDEGSFEPIVVLCTAPRAASGDIARALLDDRLAACVNRQSVHSMYRWEGGLASDDEDLLFIKTVAPLFDAVEQAIREMHPYDIPEIIAVPVTAGSGAYLGWVRGEVRPPQ
ncbi:MAG: divalent-cation tolerance protein CutA [Methanomicrobiaceae archaeon]|nr:divalent-cation tolerance protein CutA [Methanomicrobiaceae archaeon]